MKAWKGSTAKELELHKMTEQEAPRPLRKREIVGGFWWYRKGGQGTAALGLDFKN